MSLFFPVLFAVFAACCLGQFVLVKRVRQALATRHPDVWRRISTQAMFTDSAVSMFARKHGDRGLNDPDLSARAGQLRLLSRVAIGVWILLAVSLVAGGMLRR